MPLPDVPRCDAFWSRQDADRPLLSAWVGSYETPKLFPSGLADLPAGELDPGSLRVEAFGEDYERLYELQGRTEVDVPWVASPPMVVPWVEAIAGCPIHHHDGNMRAAPWLESYDALNRTGLQPDRAWLETLVEFTRGLVRLSDGRFPVGLSLMRGPADLLGAMRGTEALVYDLFDHPEAVARSMELLTDLWIQAARAQLEQIPVFADGYCFSIQALWSRRRGGWFQDDAIAYWSPDTYRQYAEACEARLSQAMDATGIHLHPPSLFTVDHLLEMPALDVIQVNLDDVGPRIPEMIPRFQQILDKKRLLVWGAFTGEDLRTLAENLPTAGFGLQLSATTPDEVNAMVRQVRSIWNA